MSRPCLSLVAGRDYPGSWDQFLRWFREEADCLRFLEQLRWPNGFVCPRCAHLGEPYRLTRGRLMCHRCRYQGSVTVGTIFEKTRTPLRNWLAAAWYLTNQKHGISALGLQRLLGLGSYQTAWAMLHRLRRAMVIPGRERLHGVVEVDETYVGGPERGARRRGRHRRRENAAAVQRDRRKATVAIAVEVQPPRGFGRVRLRRLRDTSEDSVVPFVREAVEPGAIVHTDGSFAYRSLRQHGYRRDRTVVLTSGQPAHVLLPGVHRIAALLKRWLLGTHQGAIQAKQLDYYLDEYTFRFNRRRSRSRGLLFYRLLEQAVMTEPVTYQAVKSRRR